MTGELAGDSRCPLCGGRLQPGMATVPFLFPDTVVLIKNVPAQICSSCHEPYTSGSVTDRVIRMLKPLRHLQAEILVLSYWEHRPVEEEALIPVEG